MFRIEKAVFPNRDVKKPELRNESVKAVELKYSPPVQVLVDEHKIIKRWLALIPRVIQHVDVNAEAAWGWISQGVDVIRNYADRYHHKTGHGDGSFCPPTPQKIAPRVGKLFFSLI